MLVWAGVNNFWNLKGRENDPDGPRYRFGLNELRLYRFLNLLRAGRDTEATFAQRRPDARFVEGDVVEVHRWRLAGPSGDELLDMPIVRGDLDPAAVEVVTREDLTGVVRVARVHRTSIALVAYPFALTENGRAMNRAIRAVASTEAVPLIETEASLPRLRRHPVADLAFPDTHPKPLLYAAIARDIARRLVRERLVRRHAVPSEP